MSDPEETKEMETLPPDEPEPAKKNSGKSWEKELVKRLDVTWGDAKAILQIAKDELGIAPKDNPADSKDEVFAKCDEVAESFEKTPKVSLTPHPRDSIKTAEEEPQDLTWEEQIKMQYKCTLTDATSILQMAKHELEVDENSYPEDKKDVIFAKVKELSEGFDFAPLPESATVVFVRDPWADELSHELNCRITNAKQLLMLAKRDLGLPDDQPAPEHMKKKVFDKAREIAATYDLTPKDKPTDEVDNNKVGCAIIILLLVIGAIVGISVGVSRRNRNDEESAPAPTEAPTAASVTTVPTSVATVPIECDQVEMEFSVPALSVAMAVSSDISDVEINYAAAVFQRTYVSVLTGVVEGLDDYCDPFCRTISTVNVISSEVVDASDSSFVEEGCDGELDLVFGVEGTFVGCPETEFPGLFGAFSRRQLSVLANTVASKTASQLRGGAVRWLDESEELCGSCPDDSTSLGNVVPTEEEMIEIIDPLLSVLPSVCAVTNIVEVAAGGEAGEEDDPVEGEDDPVVEEAAVEENEESDAEGQGPPEGGWTEIECSLSFRTGSCTSFLEANSGAIPCNCDGKCIQFVNGEYINCNDSGEIGSAVSGTVSINAAGCTFASHAAEILGFTCFP